MTYHLFNSSFDFLGKLPYDRKTMSDVIHDVGILRHHLDIPLNCPTDLSHQLVQCWNYNPNDRPSFSKLVCIIQAFSNNPQSDSD